MATGLGQIISLCPYFSLKDGWITLTLHGCCEVWIQSTKSWYKAWQKVRDRRQSDKTWMPASYSQVAVRTCGKQGDIIMTADTIFELLLYVRH